MNRVDINGRFLTQIMTGVQRCGFEWVRELDRRLGQDPEFRSRYSFRLLTPHRIRSRPPWKHITQVSVGRLSGHAWEQLELPLHTRGRLLLNLCNTAPVAIQTLTTIHDASVFAVPTAYSLAFRAWYQVLLPLLGRRSLRVITVSRFSQEELIRRARIPRDRLEVVPLGGEHILRSIADERIFSRLPVKPGHYLLAVGSRSPHKNFAAVIAAVSRLDPPVTLVVAGGANSRIFDSNSGVPENGFHPAGYVSDEELRALYQHAIGFIYPSLYEGFGLPALEAMWCGCPCVVSNTASLPEICGNAALYCNPGDPDDIARQIRVLLTEPDTREELRRRGLERARDFSWERSTDALLKVIEKVQPA
jgi:glycosyltransferase involved in cell wall biosynthesis